MTRSDSPTILSDIQEIQSSSNDSSQSGSTRSNNHDMISDLQQQEGQSSALNTDQQLVDQGQLVEEGNNVNNNNPSQSNSASRGPSRNMALLASIATSFLGIAGVAASSNAGLIAGAVASGFVAVAGAGAGAVVLRNRSFPQPVEAENVATQSQSLSEQQENNAPHIPTRIDSLPHSLLAPTQNEVNNSLIDSSIKTKFSSRDPSRSQENIQQQQGSAVVNIGSVTAQDGSSTENALLVQDSLDEQDNNLQRSENAPSTRFTAADDPSLLDPKRSRSA